MLKKSISTIVFFVFYISVFAQIPAGYYNSAAGKTGAVLKTALYNIIKNHTVISYDGLWTSFHTTDLNSSGKMWDMYSNCIYTYSADQCGSYSGECPENGGCYNREHSFPKSWFGDVPPMNSDLFHLYPTDGKVNGMRSNYPFGKVGSATYTSLHGGSKLGPCVSPGYAGIVFEPIDEYKGDFARTYFYMATRYENLIAAWQNDDANGNAVMNGTAFPAFEPWALNLLLTWSNNDPVSVKETNRNNVVYGMQHNRNPFIDHPEYAAAIWGSPSAIENIYDSNISIEVYPNPATDLTTINVFINPVTDFTVNIFNTIGDNVYTTHSKSSEVNVDLNNVSNGTYIIRITDANGKVQTKKLVVIK